MTTLFPSWITPQMFGGGTTASAAANSAAFAAAKVAAHAIGEPIAIPAGTYDLDANWIAINGSNQKVLALGDVLLRFPTHSGRCIDIDDAGNSMYNVTFGGEHSIRITGNANTTEALYVSGAHHSNIHASAWDCTTGIRAEWCVCSIFQKPTVSSNENTSTVLQPTDGMVLATGAGGDCSWCTINMPLFEGLQGTGILGVAVWGTTIIGGTSEGNDKGVVWASGCDNNHINGMDFEGNATSDIEDAGNRNVYTNVNTPSLVSNTFGNCNVGITGENSTFVGGELRGVNLLAGARDTSFFGSSFSDHAGLGIQGSGTFKALGCVKVDTSGVITSSIPDRVGALFNHTPTVTPASGSFGTTATRSANYYRQDLFVHVSGDIDIAPGTASGTIQVELPVQARNATLNQRIPVFEYSNLTLGAGYTNVFMRVAANAQNAVLVKQGDGVPLAFVNVAHFSGNVAFAYDGSYQTVPA